MRLYPVSRRPTPTHALSPLTDIVISPLGYLSNVWASTAQKASYATAPTVSSLLESGQLVLAETLAAAVKDADLVQEQGPENVAFKQNIWAEIEANAPKSALFWTSTSGITASTQGALMQQPERLLVLHPFNPPHIMPLLELVTSTSGADKASTSGEKTEEDVLVQRTLDYWNSRGRQPVILRKEVTGFVANRLAMALLREAAYLVEQGVASAADIDRIVEQSLGPRWAVHGPFWSYHAGGGAGQGLGAFFDKIGGTVQACWDDAGKVNLGEGDWQERLVKQVEGAYGVLGESQLKDRDDKMKQILDVTMQ